MLLGHSKTTWRGKKVNNFLSPKIIYFLGVLFFFSFNLPLFWAPKPPHNYPQNPSQNPKGGGGLRAPQEKFWTNSGQWPPGQGWFGGVLGRGVQKKILDKFWICPEFFSRKKFWTNPEFSFRCAEFFSGHPPPRKNSGCVQNFFLGKISGQILSFVQKFFSRQKIWTQGFYWTKNLENFLIFFPNCMSTPLPRAPPNHPWPEGHWTGFVQNFPWGVLSKTPPPPIPLALNQPTLHDIRWEREREVSIRLRRSNDPFVVERQKIGGLARGPQYLVEE